MYWPVNLCIAELWTYLCLTYVYTPSTDTILKHKESLAHKHGGDIHIIITPTIYNDAPAALYHIYLIDSVIQQGVVRGIDHM